jgi:hypothetical protein
MDNELFFLNAMNRTKILRPPKHTLATFGTTTFHYVLLSEIPENQCRLREGQVTAQRPQIITPDLWRKRFEGFGEETEHYKSVMEQLFGDALRGLEYTFKNDLEHTSVESRSLQEQADRTIQVMNRDNAPRTTLLQGPDTAWGLSVMKFIVDMSMRSFPVNLREMEEHDVFEPHKRVEARTRYHMERLFKDATQNPAMIRKLGEALKESGLFGDYEDRFFALVRNNPAV